MKVIEMKLSILQATTYCILTELFGLKKVNSRFVPHKLTEGQKVNIIEIIELIEIAKTSSKVLERIKTF